MECLICGQKSEYFLTKKTFKKEYLKMVENIDNFNYYKCVNCGFTISKTHVDMPNNIWLKLNDEFHHFIENNQSSINQPPYLEQAMMINVLYNSGLLDINNAIDYAGGYGTLSLILKKYFGILLPVYDPFVNNSDNEVNYINLEFGSKFKVLFNSALFEHLFKRDSFDLINNLIDDDGCMILHTVVCENIPNDPNWFYMEPPVHCAFHTNRSMQLLMNQWGFVSSLYCPAAKSWVLFKKEPSLVKESVIAINKLFQKEILIYKLGFVDYWKGF